MKIPALATKGLVLKDRWSCVLTRHWQTPRRASIPRKGATAERWPGRGALLANSLTSSNRGLKPPTFHGRALAERWPSGVFLCVRLQTRRWSCSWGDLAVAGRVLIRVARGNGGGGSPPGFVSRHHKYQKPLPQLSRNNHSGKSSASSTNPRAAQRGFQGKRR